MHDGVQDELPDFVFLLCRVQTLFNQFLILFFLFSLLVLLFLLILLVCEDPVHEERVGGVLHLGKVDISAEFAHREVQCFVELLHGVVFVVFQLDVVTFHVSHLHPLFRLLGEGGVFVRVPHGLLEKFAHVFGLQFLLKLLLAV